MAQLGILPSETPAPDPSPLFDAPTDLRYAVHHLLDAMDKGHFDHPLTVCGNESAYVTGLRNALARADAQS